MTKKPNLPVLANSTQKKIYKNKKLNNANFGDFNLNDYQVFLHIVSKLGKIDTDGAYFQPENLQREHTLTALEFSKVFNIALCNAYPTLKKAGAKMMKSSIILEKPDLFETWEINVLSIAKYNHKEGSITIRFTEEIMPYLAQVKQRFVLYNIKEIANFGSLYTTRLYELIQEFKDTGYIIKNVEQLRDLFAVGGKYKTYRDFKLKTFQHAINEINDQTDYNITFTEIKTGRKVTSIEFSFKKTIVEKRFKPDGSQVNNYIKPKHNSDKIEAKKAAEPPKQPAPAIAQKVVTARVKEAPSNTAIKAISDLKEKFRVK